jgi:kynurenine formamidase
VIQGSPKVLDISVPCPDIDEAPQEPPFTSTCTIFYRADSAAIESEQNFESLPDKNFAYLTLPPYFGSIYVLDLSESTESTITYPLLKSAMEPYLDVPQEQSPLRYLIKTKKKGAPNEPQSSKCLAADALLFLFSQGVVLLGLDTEYLDPPGQNPTVSEFMRNNKMVWLLGLNLENAVSQTRYLLNAFPVMPDQDGVSPARAVLIEVPEK